MKKEIIIKASLVSLLSLCFCARFVTINDKRYTYEEYQKQAKYLDNPNNLEASKRSKDIKLFGRWILENDNKYEMIKDYGITFSKENYKAKFIYENAHYTIYEFIGNGSWFTYKNRLYLKTTWEKIEAKYDSIQIEGEIIRKDTIEEDWNSIRYKIKTDSSWCWKWEGDKSGPYEELSSLYPKSDNFSGEECFKKEK
jgi:hypothetical protein